MKPSSPAMNSLHLAALLHAIRPTYGPAGADQLLDSCAGKVTITNSGRTILEALSIEDPVSRVLVDAACAHGRAVGDGTTGLVIALCETMLHAEDCVSRSRAGGGTCAGSDSGDLADHGAHAALAAARGALAVVFAALPSLVRPALLGASRVVRALPRDLARPDSPLVAATAALVSTVCKGKVAAAVARQIKDLLLAWLAALASSSSSSPPPSTPRASCGNGGRADLAARLSFDDITEGAMGSCDDHPRDGRVVSTAAFPIIIPVVLAPRGSVKDSRVLPAGCVLLPLPSPPRRPVAAVRDRNGPTAIGVAVFDCALSTIAHHSHDTNGGAPIRVAVDASAGPGTAVASLEQGAESMAASFAAAGISVVVTTAAAPLYAAEALRRRGIAVLGGVDRHDAHMCCRLGGFAPCRDVLQFIRAVQGLEGVSSAPVVTPRERAAASASSGRTLRGSSEGEGERDGAQESAPRSSANTAYSHVAHAVGLCESAVTKSIAGEAVLEMVGLRCAHRAPAAGRGVEGRGVEGRGVDSRGTGGRGAGGRGAGGRGAGGRRSACRLRALPVSQVVLRAPTRGLCQQYEHLLQRSARLIRGWLRHPCADCEGSVQRIAAGACGLDNPAGSSTSSTSSTSSASSASSTSSTSSASSASSTSIGFSGNVPARGSQGSSRCTANESWPPPRSMHRACRACGASNSNSLCRKQRASPDQATKTTPR